MKPTRPIGLVSIACPIHSLPYNPLRNVLMIKFVFLFIRNKENEKEK